jgi:hypothetical protein
MQALFCITLLIFSHHASCMADTHKQLIEELKAQYDKEEWAAAENLKKIHEKKERTVKV